MLNQRESRNDDLSADDSLMTLDTVGRLLSVSKRTVYRLIAEGVLPPVAKVGHSSRLLRSDVEKFFENLRRKRKGYCGV